jgi:uncharacterized membrane protein YbaN (DUF454 family)
LSGFFRHLWGWVLVIVGIAGLILPIMPGWIFLIPGLIILSDYIPPIRRLVDWAKRKAKYGEHTDRNQARRDDPGNH